MNRDDKIFSFPKILFEAISLHKTIGLVEVATIIFTEGIFIEAMLHINTLIVCMVWEKLNLFKHENDESIIIDTEYCLVNPPFFSK